ncbi:SMP-30/gluconolactonase/LRE family protein [Pseudomonas taeanensis]|uniref:SMP-30/gluconolactonase/LRE family protein n=1 Tax=Pseudomonas taeanensis TaxID=574962 RepID=UPI0009F891CE|nr:SMP-30/gluconolactonase/LRE family protein [Pseudomonas taeanensis]
MCTLARLLTVLAFILYWTSALAGNDALPCVAGQGYLPVCGLEPAEDLELTPDGRYLLMSVSPGLAGQHQSRLRLFNVASQMAEDLPLSIEAQSGWGDADCAAPEGAIGAHGIHLSTRAGGRQQLLVVNHVGREAVEFIELKPAGDSWVGIWRGCVQQSGAGRFNDVAAIPQGGFVATVMFESTSMAPPLPLDQLLDGRDTGYLMRWVPGQTLRKVVGSEAPFPNGVQVSNDGRYAWFAAWSAMEIRQFDLHQQRLLTRVPVGYLVDNLSRSAEGHLLGAGIIDAKVFSHCFSNHLEHCPSGFKVSVLNTDTLEQQVLFEGGVKVLAGASVAVEVGDEVYVGAYTGDRLLRLVGGRLDKR